MPRRLRTFALVLLLSVSFAANAAPLWAQDDKKDDTKADKDDKKDVPVPAETTTVTHHEMSLGGHSVRYTATVGNLVIKNDDDKPYGSGFYVAYTLDGAEAKSRPVTFLYNGGPGAASIWLHMGSVGPMRVVTSSPEATPQAPYQLVPNEYTLLDKTDLVFLDAIGTGFSKPVGKGTIKEFAGTDQDIRAFDRIITRWVSVNQRWNSPKFLFGESYGTTRSAGLAGALTNDGMSLNGVILLSSILNYGITIPGYDSAYIANLPSYAAIAAYHNKLAKKPADITAFLNEVRAYAAGPYAQALAQGDQLSAALTQDVAQQLSSYTGLSVAYLKEANLRVSPSRFRKELLRDERETLGRYDARFEGADADAAGETPSFDPSDTYIAGAYTAAFHAYLQKDLNYTNPDTYYTSGPHVNEDWDWKHRAPGGGDRQLYLPDTALDLAVAIRRNPHLLVFSANGLFDLATPFFATEYDLNHMALEPKLHDNVRYGYYPAGHMVYLNVEALKQFRGDLEQFYTAATHP
jgi:carboxypeptidase C (cathepsin A)